MKYFPHIDGLRAVAVLSVLLFHLDVWGFDGGYVGVDVFFVISGFVITSIIYQEINTTGGFKFAEFYMRRARRLLPALFVVLLLSTIVAYILFSSNGLYAFGRELFFSTLSLANAHFWLQSGYFDSTADTKVLLHMWSLSVEEQFYLVWPLSLVLVFKFCSNKAIFVIAVLVFLVSLIGNIVLANIELNWLHNQAEMMFYLTPFRVYEFLVGAFAVWAFHKVSNKPVIQESLFLVGFVSIVISIKCFSPGVAFPYYYALLPCIGALCVILAKNSMLCRVFLSNRLIVSIGLISYSLYLVHWPIIVFLKYFWFAELSVWTSIFAVIFAFVLAILIYLLVETPFRFSSLKHSSLESSNFNRRFVSGCLVVSSALVCFGIVATSKVELLGYKKELLTQNDVRAGKARRYDLIRRACRVIDIDSSNCKGLAPQQVLFIGDSHEVDGYNIFHTMFGRDTATNLVMFGGTNHCDLVEGVDRGEIRSDITKRECDIRVSKLNDREFIHSIDVVVFSSNKPFARNELNTWKVLRHVLSMNPEVKIFVIGSYFNTERACSEVANRFNSFEACRGIEHLAYAGNSEMNKVYGSKFAKDGDFIYKNKFERVSKAKLRISNETIQDYINAYSELSEIYNTSIVEGKDFIYLNKFFAVCDSNDLASCPTSAYGEPMFYDQHHLSMGFAKLIGVRFLEVYTNQLKAAGFSFEANVVE